MPRPVWKA